jgi:hypothetical protein
MDLQLPLIQLKGKLPQIANVALDRLPSNEDLHIPRGHPTHEFVQDILNRGQLDPIRLARLADNSFFVIAGRKRIAAFRLLCEQFPDDDRWSSIQAVISSEEDEAAILASSASNNMQHENVLTDLFSIQYLTGKYPGMDQKAMAAALGMSLQTLRKRIRLFKLDYIFTDLLERGNLTVSVAEEIASLPGTMQAKLHPILKEKGKISSEDVRQVQMVRKQETVEKQLELPALEVDEEEAAEPEASLLNDILEAISYVDELIGRNPDDQELGYLEFIKETLENCQEKAL